MIFSAQNEKEQETWRLILNDRKTVTRRLKSLPVGKIIAVQPGRGKKAICHCKIISCMLHQTWLHSYIPSGLFTMNEEFITDEDKTILKKEAKKEGFYTWEGLLQWFNEHDIDIMETYRLELKRITSHTQR